MGVEFTWGGVEMFRNEIVVAAVCLCEDAEND